jgi:hypothetical protein
MPDVSIGNVADVILLAISTEANDKRRHVYVFRKDKWHNSVLLK